MVPNNTHVEKPGTLQILIDLYNYGQTSFHCFYGRQSGFSIRRKWSLGKGVWCREKQVPKSTFFPGYAPGSKQLQHVQFHSYAPFIWRRVVRSRKVYMKFIDLNCRNKILPRSWHLYTLFKKLWSLKKSRL